jgi:hypothetical protein
MAAMSAQMQEEFAKQQPQGVSPMSTAAFESAFKIGIVFSFIFGVAWGWALPIVILVWFARRRIRDEMATWGAQPATSAWSA